MASPEKFKKMASPEEFMKMASPEEFKKMSSPEEFTKMASPEEFKKMASRRLGEAIKVSEELIKKAWSLAMKAHKYPKKPYLVEKSHSSKEVIFSFPGYWSVNDWFTGSPFGEKKMDLRKFASLKSIGNEDVAIFNEAFLNRFDAILSQLQIEVRKAVTEQKKIVFTGHSSGGPIAILAAVWFLQNGLDRNKTMKPLCITFGSPLVGDRIFNHALSREDWSQCFTHFVMRYDIFPRVPLAPFESTARQLHHILPLLNPKQTAQASIEEAAKALYLNVMKSASSVASNAASHLMGNANKLLETVSSFIKLSPYRPFGTYVFCTGNGTLVVVRNPDSVLQILFYSSQLSSGEGSEICIRSVKDHFGYQSEIQNLEAKIVTDLDQFKELPLSSNGGLGAGSSGIDVVLNELGLSTRARLCLCAAAELEKRKSRNQKKINDKIPDIEQALQFLEGYKGKCEARKVSYYDAFKASRDSDDYNANVKRLALAGMWDEIMEMLKKYDLPDGFECSREWVDLGTRYRRIVEPLDIANYYRHLKNEDTGPYMIKGRPRRYQYTQKLLEYAELLPAGTCLESCIWAEVEELIQTSNQKPFKAAQAKVSHLESQVKTWIDAGVLGHKLYIKVPRDFSVSEDIFDKSELKPVPAEVSIGSTSLQESFQIPPIQFSVAQVLEEPSIIFYKVISLVTFNFMTLVGLSNCNNCLHLPPFGQLPFLKILNIEGMNQIEKVGFELFGTIYSSTQPFLSLQILTFRRMLEWQEWIFPEVEGGEFPHLQQLCIHRCPKLKRSLPRSLPPSTENFEISECPILEMRFPRLPSEDFFWLHDGNRMLLRRFDKLMDRPPGLPDSNVMQLKSDDKIVSSIKQRVASDTPGLPDSNVMQLKRDAIVVSSIKQEVASDTDDPINIWYSQISSLESLKVSEISQLIDLPLRLHSLKIEGCDALKSLPRQLMLDNIYLQQLYIIDCCFLESFSIDHLPTTLKSLYIRNCRKLKFPSISETKQHALLEHLCIGSSCDSLSSFHLTLFPELRSLAIWDCFNFSSISILKKHMSLDALEIRDCPKLLSFLEEGLHTPKLTSIFLSNCKNLKGIPKPMDKLISLRSFFINGCPELSSIIHGRFPENLSSLCITYCHKLTPSIQWKMHELNNLSCFEIEGGCIDLKSFPEQNLLPSSLNSLRISRLSNLEFLDYKGLECLASLETLKINGCDKLQSFPEEGLPSSVTYLYINECSLLKAKFQNRRGKEWYKIAHVTHIQIDEEVIS